MINKSKKFAFYLIVWILPIFIGIFSIIFLYNYYISRELLLKNVQENTQNLTNSAINKSEGVFNTIEKIAFNSSLFIKNQNYYRDNIINTIQEIVLGNDEIFGSCFAFNPKLNPGQEKLDAPYYWKDNGKIKSKNLANENYSYTDWEWYTYPFLNHKATWSEPYYDDGGGDILMTTYSIPIYQDNKDLNTFIGILTVDISLDWLNKLISTIEIFETGYAFLVSEKGNIIAHKDTTMVMRLNLEELSIVNKEPQLASILEDMKQGKSGFKRLTSKFLKEPSWIFYSELENNGWDLVFVFPESELYADLYLLNRQILMIFSIGLVIILISVFVVSRKVTKPLSEFVSLMNREGEQFITQEIPDITTGSLEIQTLNKSFKTLQIELINYFEQHQKLMQEKSKIDSELMVAKQIQQSMLPHYNQSISYDGRVIIEGSLDAAQEVGGDLYDFFKIDDRYLFFAIGDVSGKGIGAALFMSMVINLQRAFAKTEGNDIRKIIQKLSDHICQNNEQKLFVTLFAGILDVETGVINYINAGHNFPIHIAHNSDSITIETTHLPPLGIINVPVTKYDSIQLKNSDLLFLYTDGLTDAQSPKENMLGTQNVLKLFHKLPYYSPNEVISYTKNQVNKFVDGFAQFDDITIVVLQYIEKNFPQTIYKSNFTASLAEFERQRVAIESRAGELNINSLLVNKLVLVLEELITNIIKYGESANIYPNIEVDIGFNDETLFIEMTDDSAHFDYNQALINALENKPSTDQIGGRGLMLVAKFAKNFSYNFIDNKNKLSFEIKSDK